VVKIPFFRRRENRLMRDGEQDLALLKRKL
jgi:hypothetical protein